MTIINRSSREGMDQEEDVEMGGGEMGDVEMVGVEMVGGEMLGGGMVGVEMVGVDMEGVVMGGEANRGAEREVGKGDRGRVSLVSHICMESSFNLSG